ncbi:nickel ABC transporter permease subunit NikB [Paenibacillus sp. 598K]|nr:nickel ABC transporter permease subunit NikB [Paenibacillus sp. 598K]
MLGISVLSFGLLQLMPGDPAEIMLRAEGTRPTPEAIAVMRRTLGLDQSLLAQYGHWLGRLIRLDLGLSLRTGRPVATELLERLPATAELAAYAIILALLAALPIGIGSALRPGGLLDRAGRIGSLLSVSMPAYGLGLLLLYYGSVKLRLFPVVGRDGLTAVLLPALTLGCGLVGVYIRLLRASMLAELDQLYIKAARARGLSVWQVIVGHALRNAILPSLALLGVQIGGLLGGSVIVESIFSWPGVGMYAVEAIFAKDYLAIQGYVLMMAIIVVLVNLVVDALQLLLDPRLRTS